MRSKTAYSITGAPTSHSQDVRSREVRYLWSMGIRTACFLAAVFLADGWLRWVLIAGAVFLPYVAVVLANAGRDARRGKAQPYVPPPGPELSPGRSADEMKDLGTHRPHG